MKEDDILIKGQGILENYAAQMWQVNTNKVAAGQKQLTLKIMNYKMSRSNVINYFKQFDRYFGVNPCQEFHIDLVAVSELAHHKKYPVPCTFEQMFKKEFQHAVDIGILNKSVTSKWTLPCFIATKKDS